MKTPRPQTPSRRTGYTLIEMLFVVAIIAIIAIMLLPAVSKAKGRSKQIACLSQLKQIGLGFITYAHDHGDRFPFQVPAKEGGTAELLQLARQTQDDIYYAYAHFQAISNQVNEPKVFACPADYRLPADSMREMRNENISYILATTATFSDPDSLLAGDRHIRDANAHGSILKFTGISKPVWTAAGHEFKGNLLFSGGHAERTGNAGLTAAMFSPKGPVVAWVPTAEPIPTPSTSGSSTGSGGTSSSGGSSASKNASESERGFSMLKNFFDDHRSAGNTSQGSSPQQPSGPRARNRPTGAAEEPLLASPTPAREPFASNRPPAVAKLPPGNPVPDEEIPTSMDTAGQLPEILAVLADPDRCPWCWWLLLGGTMLVAMFLGWLVYRKRSARANASWTPEWQVPQPPAHR